MLNIVRLAHVGVRVVDFKRSIAFYRKLGFRTTHEDYTERVVVIEHPSGVELNLLDSADDDNAGKNILMDVAKKYPGYTHISLQVSSVQEALAFLAENNITITEGPVTFGDGSTAIFFRDPDKNVIELTECKNPATRRRL